MRDGGWVDGRREGMDVCEKGTERGWEEVGREGQANQPVNYLYANEYERYNVWHHCVAN